MQQLLRNIFNFLLQAKNNNKQNSNWNNEWTNNAVYNQQQLKLNNTNDEYM